MYDYFISREDGISMERKWTPAQLSAINARNKKILVSAAAGSGKTATLIERIIRSLTEDTPPMDLGRMLIVTFTKAAAAELKLRILSALNAAISISPESKHLRRQMLLLESAQICTIDSFCLNVLKDEFQNSDNDASFSIGDENELKFIKVKAMDASVEEVLRELKSEGKQEAVLEFFSVLTGPRRDTGLAEKLIAINSMLGSSRGGIENIKDAALRLDEDAECGDICDGAKKVILYETGNLLSYVITLLNGYLKSLESENDVMSKYGNTIRGDLEICERILGYVKQEDYPKTKEALCSCTFGRLGVLKATQKTPKSESFAADRTAYKKAISKLASSYYAVNSDDIKLINEKSSDFLAILYRVLSKYDKNYSKAKRNAHLLEFDDLKAGVHKLFVDENGDPTPLALEYSSKYDIIYIDEYQDVDPIQDSIFNALATNSRLFMVGDIKQSIYGFRGSDPSIFGRLRESFASYSVYGENTLNAAIYMSNNFRCSRPIINAANFICSHLFYNTNSSIESIGYGEHDDLIFSKAPSGLPDVKCEFTVIEPTYSDDAAKKSSIDVEIKYVAYKITEMIANQTKEDGSSFTYSDFAILCDKNAQVKAVSDFLNQIGIPCDEAASANFFSSPEILLIRSLLSVIDNPLSDVHTSAVLMSPIFSFSADDLLKVRKSSEADTVYGALCEFASGDSALAQKCASVRSFVELYGGYASSMQISEFLTLLWNRLDIAAIADFVSFDERTAEMRRENIEKLYNYALAYSSASFKTLHSFLVFLNDIIEVNPGSQILPAASSKKTDNVHVMTIHKSKGLEFPVCFIVGTGAPLTGRVHDSEVVYDRGVGLYFDPAAKQGLVRIRSPYKTAVLSRIKEKQTLEKIRLLYVALTRARERLFITAMRTPAVEKALKKYTPAFSLYSEHIISGGVLPILNASTYTEWILLSDPFANEASDIVKKEICESEIPDVHSADTPRDPSQKTHSLTIEEEDMLERRFSFSHFSPAALLPSKISVSDLSPDILDKPLYSIHGEAGDLSFEDRPWFMLGSKNATAAERGTATHLFLQFADFDFWKKHGTDAEISRLTEEGFILKEHADIIDRDMLESFFVSDFFSRLLTAKRIWREQRFNMHFPADPFTSDPEKKLIFKDESVLVQGVIDVIFEDAERGLILADYKTDYVSPSEMNDVKLLESKFSQRYARQLSYYALAVERLFGKRPDAVTVYSLAAKKEIPIEVAPLT